MGHDLALASPQADLDDRSEAEAETRSFAIAPGKVSRTQNLPPRSRRAGLRLEPGRLGFGGVRIDETSAPRSARIVNPLKRAIEVHDLVQQPGNGHGTDFVLAAKDHTRRKQQWTRTARQDGPVAWGPVTYADLEAAFAAAGEHGEAGHYEEAIELAEVVQTRLRELTHPDLVHRVLERHDISPHAPMMELATATGGVNGLAIHAVIRAPTTLASSR